MNGGDLVPSEVDRPDVVDKLGIIVTQPQPATSEVNRPDVVGKRLRERRHLDNGRIKLVGGLISGAVCSAVTTVADTRAVIVAAPVVAGLLAPTFAVFLFEILRLGYEAHARWRLRRMDRLEVSDANQAALAEAKSELENQMIWWATTKHDD